MRVQVNLSDEMVKRVDFYASRLGVSRSALCSVMIGNGVLSYDKAMDVIDSVGDVLAKSGGGENVEAS